MINNNTNITQKLKQNFGLSELTGYPRRISEAILPIVDVSKENVSYQANVSSSSSGNVAVTTLPSSKDFYLTYATLSFIKDATCDFSTSDISLQIYDKDNKAIQVLLIPTITLTAQNESITISLNNPIKCYRGSIIYIVAGAHTVGVLRKSATIGGYVIDEVGY